MERKEIDYNALLKRNKTVHEKEYVREYLKEIPHDVMKFRNRTIDTDSDVIPCILGDIQEGYSPIIIITGRQRLGKTRFGATLANFFSIFLYYKWLNPGNSYHLYPLDLMIKLKSYGIYILDEAGSSGSGINKRQWYSDLTELFDYILQTQGNLRNIYIFILPFASDLALDVRKYVDYLFSGKKKGQFKAYKIFKREDKLVKNIKDFKQVFIEMLNFGKSDLPEFIWNPIEDACNKMKAKTRIEKIRKLINKDDWLGG